MSGPFIFEESTQPISPIFWCHFPNEAAELQSDLLEQLLHITLPHCLVDLNEERIHCHQVCFVKADVIVDGEKE